MALKVPMLLLVMFVQCCVAQPTPAPAQPAPAPQQPAPAPPQVGAPEPGVTPKDEKWTWCVSDGVDLATCQQMITILDALDPELDHVYSCVVGDGDEDCMRKVKSSEANFVVLDGGEIYEADKGYGLVPVRTEVSELEGNYYGVGIVKKGRCPGSLKDLKGKRSCHTGYGRASGWVLPVSYLIDNKIMPTKGGGPQLNDIESVKAFFSKSCAANNDGSKTICTACNVTNGCTEADKYYDYEGAFRGLVEDACDVAFTKHTIPAQYSKGGVSFQPDWKGLEEVSSYQILCPSLYNGQLCTDASNYKSCNFGKAPGHAIMVSGTYPAYEINEFNNVMNAANSDPSFVNLFFSGKNVKGSIFAADATRTLSYTGTTQQLLGSLYQSIQGLEAINSEKTAPSTAPKAVSASFLLSVFTGLLYLVFQ